MRARLSLAVLLAATLAAASWASPAAAAPEQVHRAEVRWSLGERLGDRLARSCVRPRATGGGRYASGAYSQTGAAIGTVDAVARTGRATLAGGALQFRRTRKATRATRTVRLERLGVEMAGQGGYLVAKTGGTVRRIARIARFELSSGPLVLRGRSVPNTFRLTLTGAARALAPLARLGRARCRGGRARSRIGTGRPVGSVSLSFPPAAAVGLGGSVAMRLFLDAPRDPSTGQLPAVEVLPIAPADADGESLTLPITGSAPLVRGLSFAFAPTGTVATSAGIAVVLGTARVELRDLAFSFSQPRGAEGVTATVSGVRRPLATLAPNGAWAGDPDTLAAIAAGLGLSSLSLNTLSADATFTRTGGPG
jgi:hypothetical protein